MKLLIRIKTAIPAIVFYFVLLYAIPGAASAPAQEKNTPAILSAAESMFLAMKTQNYPVLWRLLTTKSRETILADTDDAIRRADGKPVSREALREDFASGGPIASEYWKGFLRRFDPDDALEKSRWEIGAMEKDKAEVLITHRGADRPAVLRMYRETNEWKAGLVETFWGR
ncbi:MAG: hypothetical protein FWF95_01040 [Syntrophorhabdaceae bacterium]|nr:hypothetical protein [Syntrophorhabdaceae bacterium]